MKMQVVRATQQHLDVLAPLFDAYRSFYARRADVEGCRHFLQQRLSRDESVVFLAHDEGANALGFTQLYPTFSSVHAARVWILNDLYVTPDARRQGVARALLQAAADFASSDGAIRLELETTPDNARAQALYAAAGWQRFDDTLRYRLILATT